jgi:hypothetical protein
MFADVELGRAHQVSDVLDDHQVQRGQVQTGQRPVDHRGVEVAFTAEAVTGVEQ